MDESPPLGSVSALPGGDPFSQRVDMYTEKGEYISDPVPHLYTISSGDILRRTQDKGEFGKTRLFCRIWYTSPSGMAAPKLCKIPVLP